MPGDPFGTVGLESFDLVLRGPVEFLACNIVVDLRRPFPVRAVGAAEVAHIGYTGRAFFLAVAAEGAGTGVAAALAATGATVKVAGRAPFFLAVAAVGTVCAVAERLAVFSSAKPAAVTFTVAARTIAEGPVLPVTVRLTVTVTERLAVAVAGRLAVATTETAAVAFAIAPRTITEGTVLPVAIGLTVTVSKGLTLASAKPAAVTFAITTWTITKRTVVPIAKRLTLTVTERLTLASAKPAAVTFTITARAITKRLFIAVAERLALSPAGCALGGIVVVPAWPGAESAGFTAGVVVSAEPAAIIPAAIAAVVLSHVDSSCCEPTTGATAAARIRVSFPTQPEIKRFEVRTSSSILVELPHRAGQVNHQAAASWQSSHPPDALSLDAVFGLTLSHLMRCLG
ncbi:hypothetical protein ARTSIC4J27_2684 [Pseudarthrobacter siccitolerans]|uniref:Uncharacterized protein n=1 Tax=Pseudarthrobacter siccitolerans TaxID=861266 RepID=A0A024H3W9_9MICC|nr:hypothetical protein ARTSIC4J27_2684 [Pseudarthrobacter siccitolerans]